MNNHYNLPDGFIYLDTINNKIIPNLMYNTNFNFVGEKINGYQTNRVILTEKAAKALNEAWKVFDKDGYNIVIYDSYRPQKGVEHFIKWSKDEKYANSEMKQFFFPYLERKNAFAEGYVAKTSSHSRGSTVDLTIIKKGDELIPFVKFKDLNFTINHSIEVKLSDGRIIKKLNDGTVDMGASVDLMDEASHPYSSLVSEEALKNRKYFINVMENAGFEVYDKEWWHFTLKNEQFPETYFDFDIK